MLLRMFGIGTANAIAGGQAKGVFSLGGKTYSLAIDCGTNHSHGGLVGFSRRMWSVSQQKDCLEFSLFSPDGEEGYPGNLRVKVTFSLSHNHGLTLAYDKESNIAGLSCFVEI